MVLSRFNSRLFHSPCKATASHFAGTHVANAHPEVSLVHLRAAAANFMLSNLLHFEAHYFGLASLAALSRNEASVCPMPDAAVLMTATVCAWRALMVESMCQPADDGNVSTGLAITTAMSAATIISSVLASTTTRPARAVITPGPRALAAAGGALPPELLPQVMARTIRQGLLLTNHAVVANVLCDTLLGIYDANWCA